MEVVKYLNKHFKYTSDGSKDKWTLMKEATDGSLRGDCEDYALYVAYHAICGGKWSRLWWKLFTREIKFHFVRDVNNGGHCVLEHNDLFIDNWTKRWVDKAKMSSIHRFRHRILIPTIVWKLLR